MFSVKGLGRMALFSKQISENLLPTNFYLLSEGPFLADKLK